MRFAPLALLSLALPALAAPPTVLPGGPSCAAPSNPAMVVAKIGGKPITLGEVDQAAAADLYEARQKALDHLINERVLEPAAKRAGKSVTDMLADLVQAKVPDVSEREARDFYEKNKDRLPERLKSKTFDDLKETLIAGLTNEKRQAAVGDVMEDLRKQAGVEVILEPPHLDVAAVGPVRGAQAAAVTIIEFSDFQCPYCARARDVMNQVLKAYPGKVRLVYRDYPLPFHEHAEKAAEAGRCADEQHKFWPLHDWMFDHQDALSVEDLEGAAKKLGLDGKKLHQCLSSGKYATQVADSVDAGEKLGVHGTPAFFVNGVFVNGALPFDTFRKEIDRALAKRP
jgi:protein-disulfide isomerase